MSASSVMSEASEAEVDSPPKASPPKPPAESTKARPTFRRKSHRASIQYTRRRSRPPDVVEEQCLTLDEEMVSSSGLTSKPLLMEQKRIVFGGERPHSYETSSKSMVATNDFLRVWMRQIFLEWRAIVGSYKCKMEKRRQMDLSFKFSLNQYPTRTLRLRTTFNAWRSCVVVDLVLPQIKEARKKKRIVTARKNSIINGEFFLMSRNSLTPLKVSEQHHAKRSRPSLLGADLRVSQAQPTMQYSDAMWLPDNGSPLRRRPTHVDVTSERPRPRPLPSLMEHQRRPRRRRRRRHAHMPAASSGDEDTNYTLDTLDTATADDDDTNADDDSSVRLPELVVAAPCRPPIKRPPGGVLCRQQQGDSPSWSLRNRALKLSRTYLSDNNRRPLRSLY